MMTFQSRLTIFFLLSLSFVALIDARDRWTVDQAYQWWGQQPWYMGFNFVPSTAVNTLEMWQVETFDAATIDRELGYARNLGFNIARVFLHHLVWQEDPKAFKARLDQFLQIADSHKIKIMFVLFDDCWNPEGYLGPQPAPIPGVHNSQWVQAPGQAEYTNTTLFPGFQKYVSDIIGTFGNDTRVAVWDIYNEPGNSNHGTSTLPLLKNVFQWARDANPSQPITAGVWNYDFAELNLYQLENSDITTFHTYDPVNVTAGIIQLLRLHGRPMICTEYMARPRNSTFETHIPLFYELDVGCINWGLVSGKTQTIYPWNSPKDAPPPKIWFHDILYPNGTAFDSNEAAIIQEYANNPPHSLIQI